ncbi:hypothetical protein HPB50_009235 [Hyalomma asiaticum]|uniref:Uncharacterized protein n=1 Tax=Hyalomma asiaticum TaxID=266040 RepID=A0ACB7TCU4_HYAAI|nr:hypothetical protein HPB50_009235 [Hyalomma asiaticum]
MATDPCKARHAVSFVAGTAALYGGVLQGTGGRRRATALKRAPGKHTRRDERSGRSVGERPTFFVLASKDAAPLLLGEKKEVTRPALLIEPERHQSAAHPEPNHQPGFIPTVGSYQVALLRNRRLAQSCFEETSHNLTTQRKGHGNTERSQENAHDLKSLHDSGGAWSRDLELVPTVTGHARMIRANENANTFKVIDPSSSITNPSQPQRDKDRSHKTSKASPDNDGKPKCVAAADV